MRVAPTLPASGFSTKAIRLATLTAVFSLKSVARTHLNMQMASLMAHLTRQARFQRARRPAVQDPITIAIWGMPSADICAWCGRNGAFQKDLLLHRQKRTARIHHVDAGQIVLPRDVLRAQMHFHRHGIISAAFDGGIIGDNDAFAPTPVMTLANWTSPP